MDLIALGINHHTAPVEIRGQIAFPPERISEALRELVALGGVCEGAILSTCNRTELYCGLQDADRSAIINWLCSFHGLCEETLQPHFFSFEGSDAVRHILRVAAGLDSVVIGEPQILGQMKTAYQQARDSGTLNATLSRLFQHTFAVAKRIRTDTAIGASPVSVAFAAVTLARQIFGDLDEKTAMLIGAGDTIELAARHLHEQRLGGMIVANRTLERAHALAAQFNGYGIGLEEIPIHLAEADIVIASTASPGAVLHTRDVKQALKSRKHSPIFMVDIAVPHDIEPEVADLDDVYLYTVDDLRDVIEENLKTRRAAAKQAEEVIDVQVERFMGWMRSLDAVSTIREFRGMAERVGVQQLEKARQQLAGGKDPARVLESLARSLVNKLVHEPSTNLRQAGFDGRADIIEAARILFNLKDN